MALLRRMTGLMLALLLALSFLPAVAQDSDDDLSEDPLDDLSSFEGVEFGVSRSWWMDFTAAMQETPTGEDDDPFADLTGLFLIGGVIVEFEEDGNAEDAFTRFEDLSDEDLASDMGDDDATVDREEVDDLGDQAMAFVITAEGDDFGGLYRYLVVQDDEYLLIAIAAGTTEDDVATVDDFAEAMVDNLDGQSGLGEVDDLGGSTGGLWEIFPDSDDEMFEGLVPLGDEVIYPEPDEDES